MPEVILAALARPDQAPPCLAAAATLAGLMEGARINVLAVREMVVVGAFAAEALMSEADAILAAQAREGERVAALKARFEEWQREGGAAAASARWIEEDGRAAERVAELGSRADVVVCARPADEDDHPRDTFRAALFGTDRPVLAVPPEPPAPFGRRIAIAWRDEKRAIKAVMPALRWLGKAAEVHVLAGVRDGAARPALPRVLVEHAVPATLHVLAIGREPFGKTLLDAAHAVGADLLVMGAYAHSPLRELLLGGVTRYMIGHADLPVLMRH